MDHCRDTALPSNRYIWIALASTLMLSVTTLPGFAEGDANTSGNSGTESGASGPGSSTAGNNTNSTSGASGGIASTSTDGAGTASQQDGNDKASGDAKTSARASVQKNGKGSYTAKAEARGTAKGEGKSGAKSANADSDSHVIAEAKSGRRPSATTQANGVTFANATAGKNGDAVATGDKTRLGNNGKREVAIAWSMDGTYSVAISRRGSAIAYSGSMGDGMALTGRNVMATALTSASAYAKATRKTAMAKATAKARTKAASGKGWAEVTSTSFAFASTGQRAKSGVSSKRMRVRQDSCSFAGPEWKAPAFMHRSGC